MLTKSLKLQYKYG